MMERIGGHVISRRALTRVFHHHPTRSASWRVWWWFFIPVADSVRGVAYPSESSYIFRPARSAIEFSFLSMEMIFPLFLRAATRWNMS